jgi:hypothetical protein
MVGQQVGVVLPAERYHHSLDVVLHQWCCSCFVNTSFLMLKHGIAIAFQQENLMSNDPFPKDCLGMYPLAFLMGICNARVFLHNLKLLCCAQLAI